MQEIRDRLQAILDRIDTAAHHCGRDPQSIGLVAVSKTIDAETVLQAIKAGVTVLGENYVQEARDKFNALYDQSVSWHFIGHLQRNKAKYVVRFFDLIHSVDSLKLARELDKQAGKHDKVQDVLVQVNIAGEDTKSGISPKDAPDLIRSISQLSHIRIKGLMTMPPFFNQPEKVRPFFKQLRQLREELQQMAIPNVALDELSMGMTGDFEVAIEEGATLVRIGTAIFGARV